VRWCSRLGTKSPSAVTERLVERYQEYLFFYRKKNGQPLAVSSQYSQLSLIKLWFVWMKRKNSISNDPTLGLELPRLAYRLPTVLTAEQIELVLLQPRVEVATGIRDRAILEMLYSTEIRRMELLRLSLFDVDRKLGVLTIREGKGKRDRVVPSGERALYWLDQYLVIVRPGFAVEPNCTVVFLTSAGKPFTPNHLSWLARRYVQAANVGKNGACHIFRHSMATLMLEGGADTRYIQAILGHARLDTTQIYTHVSIRMLKQIHTATHPSARLESEPEKQQISTSAGENGTHRR
jgi:integrase/recombinase XerD